MLMALTDTTRDVIVHRDAFLGMLEPAPPTLALELAELEELLVAVDERLDVLVPLDRRARLGRARAALEAELGRALAR